MKFDYEKEPRRDILCIDVKSFYASVECVKLGLSPLDTMLVVMSNAENTGGLVLSASPAAKERLGLSNVMRKWDIPNHPDLKIVPPRMQLYIDENMKINAIYKQYTSSSDILVYSIDETFIDITHSKKLFGKDAFGLAEEIKERILKETGLHVTIGIGDNPLLAKVALDVQAKHTGNSIAEWRYEDLPNTLWKVQPITEMWGVNVRTAKRLEKLNIRSVFDLAHADLGKLKEEMGVIGVQLHAMLVELIEQSCPTLTNRWKNPLITIRYCLATIAFNRKLRLFFRSFLTKSQPDCGSMMRKRSVSLFT